MKRAFYVESGRVSGEPFVQPHQPGDPALGLPRDGWYYWPDPVGPFASKDEALISFDMDDEERTGIER